jgi:hypothetical protein
LVNVVWRSNIRVMESNNAEISCNALCNNDIAMV